MILLVGNSKGGTGKSTIALNLACELVVRGSDIVIVDSDIQASVAKWETAREGSPQLKPIPCIKKHDDLRQVLRDLDKRYDIVIVDSGGFNSKELRSGMMVADILIAPIRASVNDFDALDDFELQIKEAKMVNEELKAFVLLNAVPTNQQNEKRDAQDILSESYDIELLDQTIADRKAYRDSLGSGCGVVEMTDRGSEKARNEIKGLLNEIFNKVKKGEVVA